MRVLMMVQLVDENEWMRGFTIGWIRALAARVEHVHVITLEKGYATLPENVSVQSMGKEKGYNRLREIWELQRAMLRVIRDTDVIFCHMTPRLTWAAAPLAMLFRKPQMLWFAHPQKTRELRLALACAHWITTSTETGFAFRSPKVHVMGQGIDTALFSPGTTPPDDPPVVMAVGRVSPIKHHHTLLEAAALLRDQYGNPPVRFAIAGEPHTASDQTYYENLLKRRAELGLTAQDFDFLGGQTQKALVDLYRRSSIAVNLTPLGSFDKVVLEAMLTGVPLVAANPAFGALLGSHTDQLLVEKPEDASSVAQRLAGLLALPAAERTAIGLELRERTAAEHSLDHLMDQLVKLMSRR